MDASSARKWQSRNTHSCARRRDPSVGLSSGSYLYLGRVSDICHGSLLQMQALRVPRSCRLLPSACSQWATQLHHSNELSHQEFSGLLGSPLWRSQSSLQIPETRYLPLCYHSFCGSSLKRCPLPSWIIRSRHFHYWSLLVGTFHIWIWTWYRSGRYSKPPMLLSIGQWVVDLIQSRPFLWTAIALKFCLSSSLQNVRVAYVTRHSLSWNLRNALLQW